MRRVEPRRSTSEVAPNGTGDPIRSRHWRIASRPSRVHGRVVDGCQEEEEGSRRMESCIDRAARPNGPEEKQIKAQPANTVEQAY
jgi:hypothetical protein